MHLRSVWVRIPLSSFFLRERETERERERERERKRERAVYFDFFTQIVQYMFSGKLCVCG